MRVMLMAIVLALAPHASSQVVSCFSSERFGNILVMVGDSERRVIELKPDRTVQLETFYGGAAGYRYEFFKKRSTVQIYVQSGVVVRICRIPERP